MSSQSAIKKFSSSAIFVLISRLLAFVAVFGFNVTLARVLSPGDFGVFALMFSATTLFCLVGSVGMNRAMVKLISDCLSLGRDDQVRQIVEFGLSVVACSSLVAGVVAFVVAMFALPANSSTTQIAILFALTVIVRNIHFVIAESARGFHETKWSNLFGSAAGGPLPHLLFFILLCVACTGQSTLTLANALFSYLASFSLTLPFLFIKFCTLPGKPAPTEVKVKRAISKSDVASLAIPMMLTQSFGLFLSQADIWLAGALVTPGAIAVYFSAQRILGFLTIPLQISGTAITPFVSEMATREKKSKLQEMITLASFLSSLPALLIGAILLAFPEHVLGFAFGEHYRQAASILRVLVVGQLICVLTGPCEIVLMMAGHQKKTLFINVASAVLILVLGTIGVMYFGIFGLACAMAFTTSLQNLVNCWLARTLVGISTSLQFSTLHPEYWLRFRSILVRKESNTKCCATQ